MLDKNYSEHSIYYDNVQSYKTNETYNLITDTHLGDT